METHTETKMHRVLLVGGHSALDFINTLGGLISVEPLPEHEHLHAYGDLLTFGTRTATLSQPAADRLANEARLRPADADTTLRAALDLRALLDSTFRPLARGGHPSEHVLKALREADKVALQHAELVPAGSSYEWSWEAAPSQLEAPLWPLSHGAVDLLTSESLERLKGCKRCRWLFLDMSKNRSRRWCSMEECGTHEKKERFIERRRARRREAGDEADA